MYVLRINAYSQHLTGKWVVYNVKHPCKLFKYILYYYEKYTIRVFYVT
jgi:hypothetical protein